MKERKRKVSQCWKISRKTRVNINIRPPNHWDFPLISSSVFLWYFLSLFISFSFLHLSIYAPYSLSAFCGFMFSSHPPTRLILPPYPLSSQCPPLSLLKILVTFFHKEKKKPLICSSHLRPVSFSSLLCHLLPFTFQCSLIQSYDKMETSLTKATKNLSISRFNYLCSLLILTRAVISLLALYVHLCF